jgi:hypothetical protein
LYFIIFNPKSEIIVTLVEDYYTRAKEPCPGQRGGIAATGQQAISIVNTG